MQVTVRKSSFPTIKLKGIVKKITTIGKKKNKKLFVRTSQIPRVGFGVNRITDSNGPRTIWSMKISGN